MNLVRLLASIYEYATGTPLAFGIVLLVGFAVGVAAFVAPLVVIALAVPALGLDHEPNKWLGSVFIVAGIVGGVVATAIALRWVHRRTRRFLAWADSTIEPAMAPGAPSPIVPPGPTSPSRLRELDSRHAPGLGRDDPPAVSVPAAPIEEGEPPTRP